MLLKLYCFEEEVDRLYLEGVLVAKKDFNLPKHNEIDTKNLYVGEAYFLFLARAYNFRSSKHASRSPHEAT